MSKIYLPDGLSEHSCKVVYNDYVRVYTNNNYTSWVDVFINQDYMQKEGFSTYSQSPLCDNLNSYTNDFYYRVDFMQILIMFSLFTFFGLFIPIKVFSKIFRKGVL